MFKRDEAATKPFAYGVVTKTFATQRKRGNGGFLGCEAVFTVPFALTSNRCLRGLAAGPDRRHIMDEKERGSHRRSFRNG